MNILFKLIEKIYYSRNNELKRKYLRKKGCTVGDKTRFNCSLSFIGTEPYLISIGSDCLFASGVKLITHDGGVKVLNTLNYFETRHDKMGRIKIGNNVYVGMNSIIMPGVTIGDNVIIGAMSVVTKDIPSNSCAVGIPAKIYCTIEDYYKKNLSKGVFFPTPHMPEKDKINYLKNNCK